jgi:competence protein ComEC
MSSSLKRLCALGILVLLARGAEGAAPPSTCPGKTPLTVHFYAVGEGLSALLELPSGKAILVDTGDSPRRRNCGPACSQAHQHLMASLAHDLHGRALSLLWITHQHSDHLGGAEDVLRRFRTELLVDNGEELQKREVMRVHLAAQVNGTRYSPVLPGAPRRVLQEGNVELQAVLPRSWPADCHASPNNCSIGLLVRYCSSSILFTGDAEEVEEASLPEVGHVTLLQVGHHGSNTSSTARFLGEVLPTYAVISSARPEEGMNREYCHPRVEVVERLNAILGGGGTGVVPAFDGSGACRLSGSQQWRNVHVSDRLRLTAVDGDVVLATFGDGRFDAPP